MFRGTVPPALRVGCGLHSGIIASPFPCVWHIRLNALVPDTVSPHIRSAVSRT